MNPIRFMRYEEEPSIVKGLRYLCEYLERHIPNRILMFEIGTYAGEAAEIFANYFREVHCVDPFDFPLDGDALKYTWEEVEASFDERARSAGNIHKHKGLSADWAKRTSNGWLDFVYIDADHSYDAVKQDIEAWYPKIISGGFIGGHDFSYYQPGVPKAVLEKFPLPVGIGKGGVFPSNTVMLFPDSSWLVKKESDKWGHAMPSKENFG